MNESIRRRLAAAAPLLLLLALGCATAANGKGPEVELQIEQLPDAGFAVEDHGAVSIAYQISVRNLLGEEITLQKVEMRTVGESPYTLRDTSAEMNEKVAAGSEAQVTFTMWSYPREQRSSVKKAVWVSGTAWFGRPTGSFRKEFTLSFREP